MGALELIFWGPCNQRGIIMDIYRSTTPTIVLHINDEDFDMNSIDICHIAIENDSGRNKKVYENTTINIEDRTISLELTQEDTLSYEPGYINLQLKIKTTDGSVYASKILHTTINDILEEAIL